MSKRKDKRNAERRPQRASPVCAAAAMGFMAAVGFMATCSAALPARAAAADVTAADDIRDIRGPKTLYPAWAVPALLAGGALLAIGGYAAWRWHRRRRLAKALLPFEIALKRLEDIRRLLDPASVREFSIAISGLVRQYIEEGFKVTATQRTTEEFLHDLLDSPHSPLAAHRNLLAQFLQQCDVAKFAGVTLSRQIMESLHQSARRFVIETHEAAQAALTPARAEQPARFAPSTRTEGGT
ncbi:MAG TPA: DUF4381 family protein [Steroidobacteraceae bacterium]|jgi:hypothetical protein|nr:DUF4381 family protein [Steroidobacteraceae bacterium]